MGRTVVCDRLAPSPARTICGNEKNMTQSSKNARRRFLTLLAGAPLLFGCKNGMKVRMDGNVATKMLSDYNVAPVGQRTVDGNPCACSKIAIIDVDGVLLNRNFRGMESLGENPVALFREKLSAAAKDPAIRSVVLRINSPGGSVTASDLMRHDLQQFRRQTGKPVLVSILDVGAGGAYYLATACDLIFAHPTSVVGGVGVVINLYNMSDTLEQQNIQPTPIRAGDHVDIGSPVKKMSNDAAAIMQEIATEFHNRFRDAVTASRPNVETKILDGRVFSATHAQEQGLIDGVNYFDDVIAEAKSMAGSANDAKVIMFRRNNDRALTEFDISPNSPSPIASIPISIPGLDRANLPNFLYLWQPEPGLEIRGY
jgi:protease-4